MTETETDTALNAHTTHISYLLKRIAELEVQHDEIEQRLAKLEAYF
jgi:hypothetical protein